MSRAAANVGSLAGLGQVTELRKRLLFVLFALIVYRIGTFIPVPGIDPAAMSRFFDQQSSTILGMFNMFSGGALERLSIFALRHHALHFCIYHYAINECRITFT